MDSTASTAHGPRWMAGLLVAHYAVVSLSILGLSATSKARYGSVCLLGAIMLALQKTFVELSESPFTSASILPCLTIQFMSSSELIIISRAVGTDFYAAASPHSLAVRVYRVTLTVWNLRRIGTKWQIANIPPYSAPRSRIVYAIRTVAQSALTYFLLDAMSALSPTDPGFYSVPKQTLGLDVLKLSWQDLAFRAASTASFWATIYCAVVLQTNSVSLLVVSAGLDDPASWPPFFGSPWDAYSLRRFWGHFWHQTWRKFLTGHADAISDKVLGIPRGTTVSVYTRLWLAFFISGACHISSDVGMGIPFSKTGAFATFLLQPVGIILEDLLRATLGKVVPLPGGVKRVLGRVWVLAFLAYSTPVWFYAQHRVAGDSGEALPVRVAPRLLSCVMQHFSG
ncbi:hypothetical protein ACKVWC_007373 [Pyricularia oryzae]